MNKNIEKILKKMNASEYKSFRYNVVTLANCFLILAYDSNFLSPVYIISLSSAASLFGLSFVLSKSDGVLYTKDFNDLRLLYDDIIKRYTKLNKEFDFKNPLEVYSCYIYMLNNGYLSSSKKFNYKNEDVNDFAERLGFDVVNGHGVCRHIASLLNDEFKDLGFSSAVASVSLPKKYIKIYDAEAFKPIIQNAINGIVPTTLLDDNNLSIVGPAFKYNKNIIGRFKTNHCINFVCYDGINYFLDPTNDMTYHLDKDFKTLYNDSYEAKFNKFYREGLSKKIELKRKLKENYFLDFRKEDKIIKNTKKICENNNDMFESFYDDNCDIYNDISKRLSKVDKESHNFFF